MHGETIKIVAAAMACVFAACAHAAWYWPFGDDEDGTNSPPRLHRLLVKANDYIELAEDEQLNGNADKAIENYRLAISELDRIERENPERAETQEFAPLRNRRAVCTAAIDAIRFAQVNENERPVAVSDTTELQKKWNKLHNIPDAPETPAPAPTPAPPPKAAEPAPQPKAAEPTPPPKAAEPASPPKVAEPEPPPKAAEPAPQPKAAVAPVSSEWERRFRIAYDEVKRKDYAAADVMLAELATERPNDLNVLLLRAAAQSGLGSNFAARRTLEKAMRAHPRSPLPYYNLAYLTLLLGEGKDAARQYYEMGRAVGGKPDENLRAKTGSKE